MNRKKLWNVRISTLLITIIILLSFTIGILIFGILMGGAGKREVLHKEYETAVPTMEADAIEERGNTSTFLPTGEVEEKPVMEVKPTETFEVISSPVSSEKAEIPYEKENKKGNRNDYLIAIDAGHQLHGDNGTEPIGPGASEKKAKVSSGATGVSTGVPEYQLNLTIAKKLKKELLRRRYQVYMIRESNDVKLSNVERAVKANKSGADIYIRLHADGSDNSSVKGASALYPTKNNPYVGKLSTASKKLSQAILDAYCSKTGIKNRGLSPRDDLTGTNWSKIPVSLIEMGFLSNPGEDEQMQNPSFQKLMVKGISDGIDAYFGE